MNNTKWEELRLAMYNLGELRPMWRVKDLSGHLSEWDGEWYYHFRGAGYGSIAWVEIKVLSADQEALVRSLLQKIHLPGHRVEDGFRIYGYVEDGFSIGYIA